MEPKSDRDLSEIAQLHEGFLGELEGLAIQAIATGNWQPVHELIEAFRHGCNKSSPSEIVWWDGVIPITVVEVEPMN